MSLIESENIYFLSHDIQCILYLVLLYDNVPSKLHCTKMANCDCQQEVRAKNNVIQLLERNKCHCATSHNATTNFVSNIYIHGVDNIACSFLEALYHQNGTIMD